MVTWGGMRINEQFEHRLHLHVSYTSDARIVADLIRGLIQRTSKIVFLNFPLTLDSVLNVLS